MNTHAIYLFWLLSSDANFLFETTNERATSCFDRERVCATCNTTHLTFLDLRFVELFEQRYGLAVEHWSMQK